MKKLSVIIGRFQPVHTGHMRDVLVPAYDESDHVLILLGSANRAPSPKDPFSPSYRADLIRAAYRSYERPVEKKWGLPKVQFRPLYDYSYNLNMWLEEVQEIVGRYAQALSETYGEEFEITLYGTKKDQSSFYVDLFPQWKQVLGEPNQVGRYSATNVRRSLYLEEEGFADLVPTEVAEQLLAWKNAPKEEWEDAGSFHWCAKEHHFYESYRVPYAKFSEQMRHGYIGVTVDGVIFNRGRVLLVKRAHNPGKGLWALPGGYVGENEDFYSACIREVREETKFLLNRGWLAAERLYDNPSRSLRGRVVTYGFGFSVPSEVDDDPITHSMRILGVAGGSDASLARWVPMSDLRQKNEFVRGMFEDHGDIVMDMYSRVEGAR